MSEVEQGDHLPDDDKSGPALARADRNTLPTLSAYMKAWWVRVRSGELGSLPIIVGLLLIVTIFGLAEDVFISPRNFTNLLLQLAGIATIAIGVVFVLLIAEIDLSVAFVSAVGGVVMTMLLRPDVQAYPWPLAIGVALLITTAIGLSTGLLVTKAGVPSFVVTLAGLLIWSGVVLTLTTQSSTSGTIRIQDQTVIDIAGAFLSDAQGWILGALSVALFAAVELRTAFLRRARGLAAKPLIILLLQIAGLAAVVGWAVWYANRDRGVPFVMVILLVFLVFWSFIAARTAFGRHIYAVGGNPEAARRAGINVDRIRIAVFMIVGFMAGAGGIILTSRIRSVSTNTGGGNLLLNVIAAAVIGGTSLFGGRGRPVNALLGALVIASVANGMDLLGLASGTKFIVTGLVLLAAVLVDSLSRKGRAAAGIV
jgi:D-xylose transport system permease protein